MCICSCGNKIKLQTAKLWFKIPQILKISIILLFCFWEEMVENQTNSWCSLQSLEINGEIFLCHSLGWKGLKIGIEIQCLSFFPNSWILCRHSSAEQKKFRNFLSDQVWLEWVGSEMGNQLTWKGRKFWILFLWTKSHCKCGGCCPILESSGPSNVVARQKYNFYLMLTGFWLTWRAMILTTVRTKCIFKSFLENVFNGISMDSWGFFNRLLDKIKVISATNKSSWT